MNYKPTGILPIVYLIIVLIGLAYVIRKEMQKEELER